MQLQGPGLLKQRVYDGERLFDLSSSSNSRSVSVCALKNWRAHRLGKWHFQIEIPKFDGIVQIID